MLLVGFSDFADNSPFRISRSKAQLLWYPPPGKFENSGRKIGRWMETEETEFLVWKCHNAAVELDNEIAQRPQRVTQWKHGLWGSSNIYQAFSWINSKAHAVIEMYLLISLQRVVGKNMIILMWYYYLLNFCNFFVDIVFWFNATLRWFEGCTCRVQDLVFYPQVPWISLGVIICNRYGLIHTLFSMSVTHYHTF